MITPLGLRILNEVDFFNNGFIVVLASTLYFVIGFMLPSFRIWHEGRDASDILGFCGARGVTVAFATKNPKVCNVGFSSIQ
jgi:Na+-transporting NADH:ubiquinone oxidoreductase subunit NqrD